jgi:tetratricopeptide (TPR) repeat protein
MNGLARLAALAFGALGLALAAPALAADAPPAAPAASSTQASKSLSTAASGDVVLSGNPRAQACQEAAKFGDFNETGIDECTLALASPLMSPHDLAATYTDRGAIRMQHRQFAQAKADFDTAIQFDPNIANAYVDRGGVMIALKRYADAIADIDRGLALGPDQPEKAWFNRAIADENLRDLKSAYADYLKASQLKPDWAAAKTELARFNVAPR